MSVATCEKLYDFDPELALEVSDQGNLASRVWDLYMRVDEGGFEWSDDSRSEVEEMKVELEQVLEDRERVMELAGLVMAEEGEELPLSLRRLKDELLKDRPGYYRIVEGSGLSRVFLDRVRESLELMLENWKP